MIRSIFDSKSSLSRSLTVAIINDVYGLVDSYGYTDVVTQGWFAVPFYKMTPSIYVKKMVDLIFAQAGYRYTSEFFNSERFGKLVIPYAAGQLSVNLSGSNILQRVRERLQERLTKTSRCSSRTKLGPTMTAPAIGSHRPAPFVAPSVPTRWRVTVELTIDQSFPDFPNSRCNMSIRNLTESTDNMVLMGIQLNRNEKSIVVFPDVTIPGNTIKTSASSLTGLLFSPHLQSYPVQRSFGNAWRTP